MNANELADMAENACCAYQKEIASMLRQQQAEIEALKQIIDANNLNQNIGQFVKPTNEPVAWMQVHYKDNKPTKFSKVQTWEDDVPLYTHPVKEQHLSLQKTEDGELVAVTYTDDEHRIVEVLWQKPPVKELTDEEIKQLQRECISDAYAQAHFHGDKYINSQQAILNFARAILREAQEK